MLAGCIRSKSTKESFTCIDLLQTFKLVTKTKMSVDKKLKSLKTLLGYLPSNRFCKKCCIY